MAHATTRRGSQTSNKSGDGLGAAAFGFVFDELRGFFFSRATDFTDHDDRLGFIVCQQQLKRINVLHPFDGVATDADAGRLT